MQPEEIKEACPPCTSHGPHTRGYPCRRGVVLRLPSRKLSASRPVALYLFWNSVGPPREPELGCVHSLPDHTISLRVCRPADSGTLLKEGGYIHLVMVLLFM